MNRKRQLSCFRIFQESCGNATTGRGIASCLGIVTHSCHWDWHHGEMMQSFVIGHRWRHCMIVTKRYLSQQTNWTLEGGMYIYMYVHAYIYFSLFLQFLFLRLQFVMWQKTFLLSMLSLELLASSFFLIKLRWCAVNFLLFQWRIDWSPFLYTFYTEHSYSSTPFV